MRFLLELRDEIDFSNRDLFLQYRTNRFKYTVVIYPKYVEQIPIFYKHSKLSLLLFLQCQIQDFPDRGAQPNGGGGAPTYYFGNFIPENCIKLKKNGPRRGCVSLVPPVPYPPMIVLSYLVSFFISITWRLKM